MKQQRTLIYSIKFIIIVLFSLNLTAQNNTQTKDTLVFKQRYGLRFGVDLGKIGRTVIDNDYTGFEINADYRLTKRLFIAGELGNEERTVDDDALNFTSTGTYFKAGVDYNLYQNWLDMENLIFSGFRLGVSSFSHTLNSFDVTDVNNQFFDQQINIEDGREFDGLSSIWGELILGIKAELLKNLFMGLNVQLKFLVSDDQPNNFENLFIPGFNRTFDSGSFGFGFGYNIQYLIPFYKKDKIVVEESAEGN
ncbi:DUF6048 family protein [Winogradskyella immobilis]|uniref:Outer membrane protein beta-barrel domain-containing protein n=1 Tax=Winogradskyella immobilis TaxID=2816852 RepID=A0ABS8EMC1_9FLAO|nr:DUF6048 family protein [Winogradskyella immobilis]MCC1483710.1 hypothetical protein [Winogradskyella immobilis]MCG0015804.1 DUF6048 family protein [Winogradskyella immobilis]